MNRFNLIFTILLVAFGLQSNAQEQFKTYKESFDVNSDALIQLDLSHTDITFVNWDKDQVEVEATIEVLGATSEEVESYFSGKPIEITGSDNQIRISTSHPNRKWVFWDDDLELDIDLDILEDLALVHHVTDSLHLNIPSIPALPAMPPLPPIPPIHFDYNEYKEEGQEYLKNWQDEFEMNFDSSFHLKFEEWGEQWGQGWEKWGEKFGEEWGEVWENWGEQFSEKWEKVHEKRLNKEEKERIKVLKIRLKEKEKEIQEKMEELEIESLKKYRHHNGPNVFYYLHDGQSNRFEVKKSIRIKLPKSVEIELNARHGSIHLAPDCHNVQAHVQHALLKGETITGRSTHILAEHSSIHVKDWKLGDLEVDFAETVQLDHVHTIELTSTSSDIHIKRLSGRLELDADFGHIELESISPKFEDIDIKMVNGDLSCQLPSSACRLDLQGRYTAFNLPSALQLKKSGSDHLQSFRGYHLADTDDRILEVDARYGNVTLHLEGH